MERIKDIAEVDLIRLIQDENFISLSKESLTNRINVFESSPVRQEHFIIQMKASRVDNKFYTPDGREILYPIYITYYTNKKLDVPANNDKQP